MVMPWQGSLRRATPAGVETLRGQGAKIDGHHRRFDRVGLRYGTEREVLRDLDFRLSEGGFYFLTGPSGAGKTSLLKLSTCPAPDARADVPVRDELSHAARDALPAYRRRIGVVFQDFRLVRHLSAFDNVALPLAHFRKVGRRNRRTGA
jgi:cell division transport system ATP-binding protein